MTHRDPSAGGMTGATGDLTPDESAGDFEPGELREIASAEHHGDVTVAQASHVAEHTNLPSGEEREPRVGGDERRSDEEHF